LSAESALGMNVIDLIAVDVADLLVKLDGRSISINGENIVLATTGAAIDRFEPDWRTRFLAVISNPTVAYMLMLLGIYGLIFEGYNPGAILPGVVGAISLLLALFAFQILPVNYAGLALILLGVILMIGEFVMPSFGALGLGGVVAFIFGSLILIDSDVPGFDIARPLIIAIAGVAAVTLFGTIWLAMRSRVRPVVTGIEQMARLDATALEDFEREGQVLAHGERWRALSKVPIHKGQSLKVTRINGLTLEVEPVTNKK
jgi:membrane-bound serine protease (ClpP class)